MVDMVDIGYLTYQDIQDVIIEIIELTYGEGNGIMGIFEKGYTLLLTTKGLEMADRKRRWKHSANSLGSPIIQILTVKELARFVEDNKDIIRMGKGMATIQVLSYKLEELLNEVYEDNYDEIFKGVKGDNIS